MKTIGTIFGVLALVAIGAGAASVAILGLENTKARATEVSAGIVDTVENAEAKVASVRLEQCQKRFYENSGCSEVFSPKVCVAESLKACDPSNPNYHGKVPEPMVQGVEE